MKRLEGINTCTCGKTNDSVISLDEYADYLKGYTVCNKCYYHDNAITSVSNEFKHTLGYEPNIPKYEKTTLVKESSEFEVGKYYMLKYPNRNELTVYAGTKDMLFISLHQDLEHFHETKLFKSDMIEEFKPKEFKDAGLLTMRIHNMDMYMSRLLSAKVIYNVERK